MCRPITCSSKRALAAPLRVADPGLAERLGDLGDLAEEDRQLVSRLVDALRVKSKVRSLARECEEATD